MLILSWIRDNYIELTGAVTGIIYVFLEIKQKIWLWPFGIITSAVYILVFFTSKFYADAGLQFYYLFISVYGWYWWGKGKAENGEGRAEGGKEESLELRAESGEMIGSDPPLKGPDSYREGGCEEGRSTELIITRLKLKPGLILTLIFAVLFAFMWFILDNFTDSPIPGWDSFLAALSIVATWMLARKILEHWILWIIVDIVSVFVYATRELYPTVVLFIVYSIMAFTGLFAWMKSIAVQEELE